MATRRKKLYKKWTRMKQRTSDPNHPSYKHYGGRGIKVCSEWAEDFQKFYEWSISNGYKEGLTIDRIENNGDYEPSNCRWATYDIQANNKRSNINLAYKGETKTLTQWCKKLKLHYPTIRYRIVSLNWTTEKAFETPVKKSPSKKTIHISREEYLVQEQAKTEESIDKYIRLMEEQPSLSNRSAAKVLGFSESYVRNLKRRICIE